MSPFEDFKSRDLEWISDFIMQQMVIMLRPMMDHLSQNDATVDYVQRMVHRLSMDVSEVRGDVERTNKYLAILRQGLGVQNEGKCVLQRSLESTTRTVKRLDDQMESMLGVMRGVEDSIGQLCSDVRGAGVKQEALAKHVAQSASTLEDCQAKIERVSTDTHSIKDDILNNEARLEVWQRELRELRRTTLGIAPKLEDKVGRAPPSSQGGRAPATDTWPQKKPLLVEMNTGVDKAGLVGAHTLGDTHSNHSGSSQQSKPMSQVGHGSGRGLLQQDHRCGVSSVVRSSFDGPDPDDLGFLGGTNDEAVHKVGRGVEGTNLATSCPRTNAPDASATHSAPSSRLPLLTARQGSLSRPPSEGPRLRFTATMPKPPSRGTQH